MKMIQKVMYFVVFDYLVILLRNLFSLFPIEIDYLGQQFELRRMADEMGLRAKRGGGG